MRVLLPAGLLTALRRIRAVARKELRQLRRDPLTSGFVLGVPILQLLLFGYAINQDVRHVPTAVVDHDATAISRRLVGQLEATQTFDVRTYPPSEDHGRRQLRQGDVQVVVVIPPDFSRNYYRGRGAEISFLVDATDPILARAVRAAADGLQEHLNRRREASPTGLSSSASPEAQPDLIHRRAVSFSVLTLHNPELRTPVFVVPALLGVILTTTMILMTAVSIVRERERGTFEFLIASPVRRLELMVGKFLPYVGIGFIQIALTVAAGLLLFHVPVVGSLLDLAIASIVFIAANLTLGLVISCVTRSQLQATQLSFFFFLPSVLLSGFMFPFNAMPAPARWLGELLPLTHYVRLARGILLRGSPLIEQPGELGALVLICLVGLVAATKLFKKQLG